MKAFVAKYRQLAEVNQDSIFVVLAENPQEAATEAAQFGSDILYEVDVLEDGQFSSSRIDEFLSEEAEEGEEVES